MVIIAMFLGCADSPPLDCPVWTELDDVGQVSESELTEASGLAASRHHPDVLWTHNDSGDRARLFALDHSATTLAELAITGPPPIDWEDISVTESAIWIGDIGDNNLERTSISVWRIEEPPELTHTGALGSSQLTLTYPDGPRDAEALVVFDDNIWIFTKSEGATELFRASTSGGLEQELEPFATFVLPNNVGDSEKVSAADIMLDGDGLYLKTQNHVLLYDLSDGMQEAITGASCLGPASPDDNGESIAAVEGGFMMLGEGINPTLWQVLTTLEAE